MYSGPKVKRDGLVFGYDTGLQLNTSFNFNERPRRFFKGKPTNNRLISEANWLHIGTEITDPADYPVALPKRVKFFKGAYNNDIRWTDACRNFTDSYAAGTQITVSGWHMFHSTDTSLTMDSRNRLGWHYSKDGTSTFGGTIYTATEWNKWYYFSNTFSSTGVTTSLRVEDGGYDYYLDSADAAKTTQYYCNLQIEIGTNVASPYSNGSRTNTDSLLDLTKSRTIDLSNMSFSSNGQPEFDGTDDYIQINNLGLSSHTLEGIIKSNDGSQGGDGFSTIVNAIGNYDGGSSKYTYIGFIPNLTFRIDNGVSSHREIATTSYSANTWYHVTLTYNASNGVTVAYLNGIQIGSVTSTTDIIFNSIPFSIGKTVPNTYFNGNVPVVKVYNRALSAAEIKQNFNVYRKRFNM